MDQRRGPARWAVAATAAAAVLAVGAPARAQLTQTVDLAPDEEAWSLAPVTFITGSQTPFFQTRTVTLATLPKFNTSLGVLQGVKLNLSEQVTEAAQLQQNVSDSAGMQASFGIAYAAPGYSSQNQLNFPGVPCRGAGCGLTRSVDLSVQVAKTITDIQTLAAYAGTGTAAFTAQETIQGSAGYLPPSAGFTPPASPSAFEISAFQASGSGSLIYTYLQHAQPGFSLDGGAPTTALTLDFGTLTQGSGLQTLSAALVNPGSPATTIGLDLDSIAGPSDPGPFSLTLATFANLLAGGSDPFSASLNTAGLGAFRDTYVLHLSDADLGVGQHSYTLDLTLKGDVIAPPPPPSQPTGGVPEPASWALMIAGFGLAGAALRGRRRLAA